MITTVFFEGFFRIFTLIERIYQMGNILYDPVILFFNLQSSTSLDNILENICFFRQMIGEKIQCHSNNYSHSKEVEIVSYCLPPYLSTHVSWSPSLFHKNNPKQRV
jgi:hypothetical protein